MAPDGDARRALLRAAALRSDASSSGDGRGSAARTAGVSPAARDPEPTDAELAQAVAALARAGREAEALRLGRAALGQGSALPELATALAHVAFARGDDAAASAFLAAVLGDEGRPGIDSPAPGQPSADVVTRALWLAGEVAERRGDLARALAYYERILSRDLDYPAARDRATRLRAAVAGEVQAGPAGGTLLADGASLRGRYRVLRELGRGGAGTVFEARDSRTGRVVALKLYHGRSAADRERLRAEARIPAGLDHPGVIRVLDVDEALVALAVERVPGGALRDALRAGPVDVARARRWLLSLGEALAFVHACGYVHRDLKPSNCLLRADDAVVLTDFGVARRIGEEQASERAGEGTLAYMPPEQRAGAPAHPSADVYAFGVTAREIAAACVGPVAEREALEGLAARCAAPVVADRPALADVLAWLRTP
jgi:serine/threonine-protein kinase